MNSKTDICERFAKNHGISLSQITNHEVEAVYWLEFSRLVTAYSVSQNTERLTRDPTFGFLQTMLDKVYEYAVASLTLYIVGHPLSGEVVARTTVEAAINVLYVLNGNRVERLWQYFSSYIATERRQNKLWLEAISGYSEDSRKIHLSGMARKEKVLKGSEQILESFFQKIGFTDSKAFWPSLFDRFKSLGKAASYRTVYAAMCSQAHNDAEDLLNKFLVYSIGDAEMRTALASETSNFSQMLIYFGLQYYLEANLVYAMAFGLSEAENEVLKGYKTISELLEDIVAEDIESLRGASSSI
jgi:hypothetical protein